MIILQEEENFKIRIARANDTKRLWFKYIAAHISFKSRYVLLSLIFLFSYDQLKRHILLSFLKRLHSTKKNYPLLMGMLS